MKSAKHLFEEAFRFKTNILKRYRKLTCTLQIVSAAEWVGGMLLSSSSVDFDVFYSLRYYYLKERDISTFLKAV